MRRGSSRRGVALGGLLAAGCAHQPAAPLMTLGMPDWTVDEVQLTTDRGDAALIVTIGVRREVLVLTGLSSGAPELRTHWADNRAVGLTDMALVEHEGKRTLVGLANEVRLGWTPCYQGFMVRLERYPPLDLDVLRGSCWQCDPLEGHCVQFLSSTEPLVYDLDREDQPRIGRLDGAPDWPVPIEGPVAVAAATGLPDGGVALAAARRGDPLAVWRLEPGADPTPLAALPSVQGCLPNTLALAAEPSGELWAAILERCEQPARDQARVLRLEEGGWALLGTKDFSVDGKGAAYDTLRVQLAAQGGAAQLALVGIYAGEPTLHGVVLSFRPDRPPRAIPLPGLDAPVSVEIRSSGEKSWVLASDRRPEPTRYLVYEVSTGQARPLLELRLGPGP